MHDALSITDDAELACPRCGETNLHQGSVEIFNPREEDEPGYPITILQNDLIRGGNPQRNPSSRRQGILIHFMCENCDNEHETVCLGIWQHKGTTFTKWLEMPSPAPKGQFRNL
jgi:hypothetical protein